eukprot:15447081-Alexandrium_andersonii.AAC.1
MAEPLTGRWRGSRAIGTGTGCRPSSRWARLRLRRSAPRACTATARRMPRRPWRSARLRPRPLHSRPRAVRLAATTP